MFGEIVEQSTRSLNANDYEDLSEDEPFTAISWAETCKLPSFIDTLLILEGNKLFKICNKMLKLKLQASAGHCFITLYEISYSKYLLLFDSNKTFDIDQIVQSLENLLKNTKHIYTIKTEKLADCKTLKSSEECSTVIKNLTTDKGKSLGYEQLESPNLITGFSASIFSFCAHIGVNCSLFLIYIETLSSDSVYAKQIEELFTKTGIEVNNDKSLNSCENSLNSNFLYI